MVPRSNSLLRCLALACAVFCGSSSVVRAQEATSSAPSYRLGPKDLLRVKVFEVPELNVDSRVSEEGYLNLPLIGDVPASGLTTDEFAERLKQQLARYVNRATVTVEILEARSRPIRLLGAVKQPGNLDLPGRWTLLDVLAAAGGLADNHADTIYILRRAENGLSDQLAIAVEDLLVNGLPEANVPIRTADLINVPQRVTVTIYCLGAVRTPGEVHFQSTESITLLAALVRAGGLTDAASNKIRVRRRRGTVPGEELVVDYKRLLAGTEPDPELEEGDVIIVKESFF
jgi:polysaccharide export outer membrane protein